MKGVKVDEGESSCKQEVPAPDDSEPPGRCDNATAKRLYWLLLGGRKVFHLCGSVRVCGNLNGY